MVDLPDKLFFKIGEVAQLVGVKPHVLRYWESEFPGIRPVKSHGNQRLYRKTHVELILQLKTLLYDQGYTLCGARRKLREAASSDLPLFPEPSTPLAEIVADLRRLRDSLR